jgi:lipoprotein NlpD
MNMGMDAMAKSMLRSAAAVVAIGMLGLVACSSKPGVRAPVEDIGHTKHASAPRVTEAPKGTPAPAAPVSTAIVDPNSGKPGYYTVKQGDTLIKIGLESGQSYREIARWNALENPNRIEIGQALRVVPPEEAVVAKPVAPAKVSSTALPPANVASAPAKAASAPASTTTPAVSASEDDIAFAWPAKGEILDGFDESKNRKGLDIGGSNGDAVLAAADGKVVYADAGLRGYGKLIIIKHNSQFLTAYAHNQTLLVKEDQAVKKGQKIAEMGNTDSDRTKLHFEVRKQGKPVDPSKYLPAR